MIYLYLFGTCFHFIYVFMIIANKFQFTRSHDGKFRNFGEYANREHYFP